MRAVVVLTLAAALSGLAACGKRAETVESPDMPPQAVADPTATPTQEQMIAAMLRGHPNSFRVCVDGERQNAFFVDYGPLPAAGSEPDNKYHGFLFIEKVEFYKTSNNTWFITNQADNKYVQVYPDVAGLTCKDKS